MMHEENIDYVYEKSSLAVFALVAGNRSLKERVWDAYCSSLINLKSDDEFPDEARERFQGIRAALNKSAPIGDEGSVWASLNQMSDQRAGKVANEIVTLFCEIAAYAATRKASSRRKSTTRRKPAARKKASRKK